MPPQGDPGSQCGCCRPHGLNKEPQKKASPGCWWCVCRVLRQAWDRAHSSYSLKGRPSFNKRSCRETPCGEASRSEDGRACHRAGAVPPSLRAPDKTTGKRAQAKQHVLGARGEVEPCALGAWCKTGRPPEGSVGASENPTQKPPGTSTPSGCLSRTTEGRASDRHLHPRSQQHESRGQEAEASVLGGGNG